MQKNEKSYSPSKPQLTLVEELSGVAVPISVKALESLATKAENNKPIFKLLEQVYCRGLIAARDNSPNSPEQQAFSRVNSFLNYGKAFDIDSDLLEPSTDWRVMDGQRARTHGRAGPNFVDNVWASQLQEEEPKPRKLIKTVKKVIRGLEKNRPKLYDQPKNINTTKNKAK
jgi:hypothetical protein